MKRIVILALGVLLITQVPAFAMTNAEPDGNRHPAVGVLFFQRESSPGVLAPQAACSGTLISPTVFLTAAHCIDEFDDPQVVNVGVHFEPTYDPFNPPKLIAVTYWAADPRWGGNFGADPDIGVVILAKAQNTMPATLPSLGLLDQMRKNGTIDDKALRRCWVWLCADTNRRPRLPVRRRPALRAVCLQDAKQGIARAVQQEHSKYLLR